MWTVCLAGLWTIANLGQQLVIMRDLEFTETSQVLWSTFESLQGEVGLLMSCRFFHVGLNCMVMVFS